MLRKTCLTASLAFALTSSVMANASVVNSLPTQPNLPALQDNTSQKESAPLLNINTATAAELSSIMIGVGVKRAEQIIKLREQLGGYTELEQLLDVKGIGLKTLEKNQALIHIE